MNFFFQDINECNIYGICSHECINTMGSYRCTCASKFNLDTDGRSCRAAGAMEPKLFFASLNMITTVLVRTHSLKEPMQSMNNTNQVVGVCFDGHHLYWTDISVLSESINRAREDGSHFETLLSSGLSLPEDIAVDWITGNLYFTDRLYMHIGVCSNDGQHCVSLVNQDVHLPRALALYPQEGRMYWTDWGDNPMIAVSNMDGTEATALVTKDIKWPNGLTLDWPNKRLYWVDAKLKKIESVDLNGNNRKLVLYKAARHPYSIAVFENNIYWSDWDSRSIQTCDKFTCKKRSTVVQDRLIYGKILFNSF